TDLGNTIGDAVTVDVVDNDAPGHGALEPETVRLVNGSDRVTELTVPDQGTWTVDTSTGAITFTPEDGFLTDPTPIAYEIADEYGLTDTAQVTVDYVPAAADDASSNNTIGDPVEVNVLGNDTGD